ncbi:MAG: DUF2807 domain-containing protein [Chitinophagales bacterium]|nr:DUF2807 domain-containing protein [Chitinophagales bacterium]
MKTILSSILILLLTCTLKQVQAQTVQKNITISNFSKIQVSDAVTVVLTKGTTPKCVVEADAKNIEQINIQSNSDKLVIKRKENLKINNGSIKVYITYVSINEIMASGASTISSDAISSNELLINFSGASKGKLDINTQWTSLVCSGASSVDIKGKTQKFNLKCSGASTVNTFSLLAENVISDISGASTVKLNAIKKLEIDASGASAVNYKQNATVQVQKSISGASSVKAIK